jgi:hypothetical protein
VKKALGYTKDDVILNDLMKELFSGKERFSERMTFLDNQRKKILEEVVAQKTAIWDRVEATLKVRGVLPPEYNRKSHALCFDEDLGVVYMTEAKEANLSLIDALGKLFT